jgi:hypothetical protein
MRHIFCLKCHRLAATIVENDGKVTITQGGRTLLSLGKAQGNNISIQCPAGHQVKVQL